MSAFGCSADDDDHSSLTAFTTMDSDRKSTSSFYGARKNSADALNRQYAHTPGQGTKGHDDASSFFQPDSSSADYLNSAPRRSAGYNRNSFFPGGREEPVRGGTDEEQEAGADAWDVYADFNNAGPRYSTAYGLGQPQTQGGYSQIPPTPPSLPKAPSSVAGDKVEMITVPALGAEWGKEELHDMTKSARKERKQEARKDFWKSWNRGERGLFGKYLTRKVLVFVLFGICCVIGIILAFTIPRVPGFSFNQQPLVNATGSWANSIPVVFSRAPTNFSFPAAASLQLNTQSSYLPIKFTHLHAKVYDLDTNRLVGTGNTASFTVPAKSFPKIQIPLNFTYIATNTSDQTWVNFYDACKNKAIYADGKRTPLKFRLNLDLGILGLPSEYHESASVTAAECPIELAMNAS